MATNSTAFRGSGDCVMHGISASSEPIVYPSIDIESSVPSPSRGKAVPSTPSRSRLDARTTATPESRSKPYGIVTPSPARFSALGTPTMPTTPDSPLTSEEQKRRMIEEKKRAAIELRNRKRKQQGMSLLAQFGLAVAEPSESLSHTVYDPSKRAGPYRMDPQLCAEQRAVMDAVKAGRNVFFTGSAGCGKSFTLKNICQYLQCAKRSFAVTAPSGIAAINVGGTTLHSLAQVGMGSKGWDAYCAALDHNKKARWQELDVLIIDEVSMLAVDLFEKVDQIARHARKSSAPFGGIQIILCGDFCQLPPVSVERTCRKCGYFKMVSSNEPPRRLQPPLYDDPEWIRCAKYSCKHVVNKDALYIFESLTWIELSLVRIMLKKVFRQEDEEFVGCLNRIRFGKPNKNDIELLRKCVRPLEPVLAHSAADTTAGKQGGGLIDIVPTNLHPTRADVDRTNRMEFAKLQESQQVYRADDTLVDPSDRYGDRAGDSYRTLLDKGQAPRELRLAVGAQVMLVKNLDFAGRLVNGSRGVVVDFVDGDECLEELSQHSEDDPNGKAAKELLSFRKANGDRPLRLPIVLFCNGTTKVIQPVSWEVQISRDIHAVRVQIPLIHAWAITIHKCQGMTLDRAFIRIEKVFSPGQAYVALSRCRTLDGLQIAVLRPEVIRADPKVVKFYDQIDKQPDLPAAAPQTSMEQDLADQPRKNTGWSETLVRGVHQYFDEFAADMEFGDEALDKQLFLETMEDYFDTVQMRHRHQALRDSHQRSTTFSRHAEMSAPSSRIALVPQKRQLEPIVLSD